MRFRFILSTRKMKLPMGKELMTELLLFEVPCHYLPFMFFNKQSHLTRCGDCLRYFVNYERKNAN